ncbi:MAG TPA: hypothetical protein VGM78_09185 [Ilumatobacteraceae bacterium]
MTSEADEGDIRTELIEIISAEFNEAGIENSVVQPTYVDDGMVSPAQMVVPLSSDSQGRTPVAHVYFLPILHDPPVVQHMVILEYEIADGAVANLARLVGFLNSNLPITGFEFNESLGHIVFRHTHAVSTEPLDPGVIAWPLTMIRYAVENYGGLVEFVAGGGDYDAAVQTLAHEFHRIVD